jgi:hypothetical protein
MTRSSSSALQSRCRRLRILNLTAPRTVVLVRTDAEYLAECLDAARGDAGLDSETCDYRARLGTFAGHVAEALGQ